MIIGVLGFAGSGKGTVADILVSKGFVKESFADPVKDAVSVIFSWDRPLLEGDTQESREFRERVDEYWTKKFGYTVTPRLMLQLMGTEAGRNVFHQDVWVHALMRRASNNKHTIIADVRFPNEIAAIKNAGGFIARVERGKNPAWWNDAWVANNPEEFSLAQSMLSKEKMIETGVHYSEWAWIGNNCEDYVVENNSTLASLEEETERMLHFFKQSDIMLD